MSRRDRPYSSSTPSRSRQGLTRPGRSAQRYEVELKERMTKSEEATRADLSAVKAELKLLEQELAFTKIPSPFDGQIGRYYENLGTLVHEGTVLTRLVSLDPMWIYWGWSAPPSCGSFGHSTGEDRATQGPDGAAALHGFEGRGRLPASGDPGLLRQPRQSQQGARRCSSRLPQPHAAGRPSAEVARHVCAATSTRRAPHRALLVQVPGPPRASGVPLQDFLYLVDDQNKVVRRSVKWGQEHDGLTVVKEGLNPGDRVIVGWTEVPRPGDIVKAKPVWMPGSQAETSAPK